MKTLDHNRLMQHLSIAIGKLNAVIPRVTDASLQRAIHSAHGDVEQAAVLVLEANGVPHAPPEGM